MNKRILAVIIGLFCLLVLSGCKKVYVQDGEHDLIMNTNSMAESDSVSELLNRAKNVSNIYYEIATLDAAGKSSWQKFWLGNQKMRVESDKNMTIIDQDSQIIYIYTPAQNKAIKMSLALGQQKEKSIIDDANSLNQYQVQVVGSETIGQMNCLVIQYQWGQSTSKVWLWKKYGLPVKIITTQGKNMTTTNYSNFKFDAIPEAMFKLPADVPVADMSNLPDLKTLNLPKVK